MKATGIIRRLDDLGRLVIPKEIRKQYRLKEGDSIEFYIENDRIILQKYDLMNSHVEEIIDMCATLSKILMCEVYFVKDEATGSDKVCSRSTLQKALVYRETQFTNERVFENDLALYSGYFYPIVVDGYWQGSFMVFTDSKTNLNDLKCVDAFAQLLSRKYQL